MRPEVVQEFVNILCVTTDKVPLADPFGGTLGARVQSDNAVGPNEVPELRLPDIGRHRPARHEDHRRTGSAAEVVEPHAIAGDEPVVRQSRKCRRLGAGLGDGAEQQEHARVPEANGLTTLHGLTPHNRVNAPG